MSLRQGTMRRERKHTPPRSARTALKHKNTWHSKLSSALAWSKPARSPVCQVLFYALPEMVRAHPAPAPRSSIKMYLALEAHTCARLVQTRPQPSGCQVLFYALPEV